MTKCHLLIGRSVSSGPEPGLYRSGSFSFQILKIGNKNILRCQKIKIPLPLSICAVWTPRSALGVVRKKSGQAACGWRLRSWAASGERWAGAQGAVSGQQFAWTMAGSWYVHISPIVCGAVVQELRLKGTGRLTGILTGAWQARRIERRPSHRFCALWKLKRASSFSSSFINSIWMILFTQFSIVRWNLADSAFIYMISSIQSFPFFITIVLYSLLMSAFSPLLLSFYYLFTPFTNYWSISYHLIFKDIVILYLFKFLTIKFNCYIFFLPFLS